MYLCAEDPNPEGCENESGPSPLGLFEYMVNVLSHPEKGGPNACSSHNPVLDPTDETGLSIPHDRHHDVANHTDANVSHIPGKKAKTIPHVEVNNSSN